MRRLKISYDNTRAIHHFYSTHAIAATFFPRHARAPVASVITHSHIIQRMNRQTKLTVKNGSIGAHRLTDTKLFKLLLIHEMKSVIQLLESFHQFAAVSETIIANIYVSSIILIGEKSIKSYKTTQDVKFIKSNDVIKIKCTHTLIKLTSKLIEMIDMLMSCFIIIQFST